MTQAAVVFFYLFDGIVSAMLRLSSGLFAVALIIILASALSLATRLNEQTMRN